MFAERNQLHKEVILTTFFIPFDKFTSLSRLETGELTG